MNPIVWALRLPGSFGYFGEKRKSTGHDDCRHDYDDQEGQQTPLGYKSLVNKDDRHPGEPGEEQVDEG